MFFASDFRTVFIELSRPIPRFAAVAPDAPWNIAIESAETQIITDVTRTVPSN